MKTFVFLFCYIISNTFLLAQDYRKVVLPMYEIQNVKLQYLMDSLRGSMGECIDPDLDQPYNVMTLSLTVDYNAFQNRVDTTAYINVVPFFGYSDRDNYLIGTVKLKSGLLFIEKWDEKAGWSLVQVPDSLVISLRIKGKFGERYDPDDSTSLPNYVYSKLICRYRYSEGVWKPSRKYPCACP